MKLFKIAGVAAFFAIAASVISHSRNLAKLDLSKLKADIDKRYVKLKGSSLELDMAGLCYIKNRQ